MVERKMSESEEMYLVTIAQLVEGGVEEPVPLSPLAEELEVLPVSVNQMVRKLEADGWLAYQPYKGVTLSEKGRQSVGQILRHRRLWQLFLVEYLGLSLEDADSLACRMEHITSKDVADRLFTFLGEPVRSVKGKPIPSAEVEKPIEFARPLNQHTVGEIVEVVRVDADDNMRNFLEQEQLSAGTQLRILAMGSKGAMMLGVKDHQVNLGTDIAGLIMVKPAQA
jgi:DtxR family Mn-dependent transcriptional regulator